MPVSNAPTEEVVVVVAEVTEEVAVVTGVDAAARMAKDAGHEQMAAGPTSMLMMRLPSPRYRENLHLKSCDTPTVKMILLQHETTTCIFLCFLSFPNFCSECSCCFVRCVS